LRYQALGVAVTYRTYDELADTSEEAPGPEEPRGRGPLFHIVVAVMLACFGSGSALLWRAYGMGLPALPSFASAADSAAPVADKPVGLSDLRALQQQIAASMQSTERLLAAQQAEIKRLSDQVVVFSGKLDLLQRPLTSAQAAIPAPAPKQVAPAPRKKPAQAQPVGAISTGGAPLPAPVQPTR
jgi:hypothetical protein